MRSCSFVYGQSPYEDSGFQRVQRKQHLNFKGWNSHVPKEFPGCFESTNLSRDNLSRSLASRRGQDKQGFHRRATNPYVLQGIVLSAHVATFCHMLSHVAICFHILPTFSRESI